ncbi:MAG: TatD family hydrolase [Cellvibrionales bacterium]|nr:TatD family hydrolase [Cellvibrionales bacterium]
MIVDSHCHLDRLDISQCGGSVDAALQQARSQGVSRFLCVGISLDTLPAMMDIVDRHDDVYASAGFHPLEDMSQGLDAAALKQWALDDRIVAVGETGLDYFYAKESAESQREHFITHLKVAAEVDKPVIIHSREARDDTLAAIAQYAGSAAGVLHCFTDTWRMAKQAIEEGFYISISGIVTFRNASELRDVVKKIPLDRLMVETDSPYLAPVPHRGKSNQPAYVREVAEYIAELRGISLEQLAEATTDNFQRLFFQS